MINILVPTDFSKLSKVAIGYAVKLANSLNGTVTLLHVIDNVLTPTRKSLREEAKALGRQASAIAKQNFIPVLAEAEKLNKTGNAVVVKIRTGRSFSNTVRLFAKRNNMGMIIMGTRGASGLAKYVLGSNTVSVLEVSPVPVLAVPGKAEFKNIKNLVYASDLRHFEKEVKALFPFVKALDAALHVLHVAKNDVDVDAVQVEMKNTLKKLSYRKSTISIKINKPVDTAIDSLVRELKADMVAMFMRKRTSYQKIFHRSMTKRMAFQSHVPLLAFKNK